MADIRIKDLATTASSTAADDFLAVDGTTNGTRKLSAATPSFATSVTVPGVSGPTTTNLTLAGGSTGASLVLGQGANASTVFTGTGNGLLSFTKTTGNPTIRAIAPPGASGVFEAYTPSTSMLSVYGLFSVIEGNGNKWEHGFYGTLDYVHRYNSSEKLRFTTTGNLLIGTTTDGGQKLQVNGTASFSGAANTQILSVSDGTRTLGIVPFTPVSGGIAFKYNNSSILGIGPNGVTIGSGLVANTDTASLNGLLVEGVIKTNNTTPSTGAGSGALQVAGGIYAGANSYFTGQITSARPFMATGSIAANMTSAGGIGFAGGGANVFSFGANASTTGAFTVQLVSSDASLNFNALTIAANTGAATFAGAVAINNTVATAVAVASTHKVTMVIGGVTYYLLASNV